MSKSASKLFLLSILIVLFSCAPKRVELPSYEGVDLKDVLASKKKISAIETRFSIIFEKDDTEMKGDGALNVLQTGDMHMRLYSFGFLAFELSSQNGIIKSKPAIDRTKGMILTDGLRDCLFWWDITDFETQEKEGNFLLVNSTRQVWIDRKTMLPVRQIISLDDGRELNIFYENPEKSGDTWYPAKIRIELSKYAVTLNIKDMLFISQT
jgi:hypothetical protein